MLQPLSPRRCAILRGLFICRITWSFPTCGECERVASALRVALQSVCPHRIVIHQMCTPSPHPPVPLFRNRKRQGLASALCFQEIRAMLLNADDNSMCCAVCDHCPPKPHPSAQTKTTCSSTKTPDSGDLRQAESPVWTRVWVNYTWLVDEQRLISV